MPTWLTTVQRIVANRQYEHVDPTTGEAVPEGTGGAVLLDLTTASIMLEIHDRLNDEHRTALEAMTFVRAWAVTTKLYARLTGAAA